jgi:hypothetical protein
LSAGKFQSIKNAKYYRLFIKKVKYMSKLKKVGINSMLQAQHFEFNHRTMYFNERKNG